MAGYFFVGVGVEKRGQDGLGLGATDPDDSYPAGTGRRSNGGNGSFFPVMAVLGSGHGISTGPG